MRALSSFLAFLALALPALAADADPVAPVQKIMEISQSTLSGNDSTQDDYFSDKWMPQLFSSAFVAIAKKGFAKAQANDEPFIDYDPVLGGQDGCAPKDLTITNAGPKDGGFDVIAKFHAFYCFDNADNRFSETHFKVVIENGAAKIDDIVNIVPDGDPVSLRDTMNGYFTAQ
ncbi:hypothetical protein ABID16_000566 [Rhizobium aquaticum]|uniref:Uncharacterized protein n=1 Tax=Rhizobium aquaticum TaxID=1549636 RepID=A0ABV2IUU7_9HYPH